MGHLTRMQTLPYLSPYYFSCQELLSKIISTSHPLFSADTAALPIINALLKTVILPASGQKFNVLPSESSYTEKQICHGPMNLHLCSPDGDRTIQRKQNLTMNNWFSLNGQSTRYDLFNYDRPCEPFS